MRLVVAVVAAFLVAAPTALAKSGVTAWLETSLPARCRARRNDPVGLVAQLSGRARPGTALQRRRVFARLLSASGAGPTVAFASPGAYPDGRYTAEVIVPEGGIGKVAIGRRHELHP